jgi:hypothetical protein
MSKNDLDKHYYCPICNGLLLKDDSITLKCAMNEDHTYVLFLGMQSDMWEYHKSGYHIARDIDMASVYDRDGWAIKDYDDRPSDEELLRFVRLSELLR